MEESEIQGRIDPAEIASRLVDKGIKNACPLCEHGTFQMQPGIFVNVLQDNFETIKLDGQAIPVAVLTCANCGLVLQFSLGKLGLLPERSSDDQA